MCPVTINELISSALQRSCAGGDPYDPCLLVNKKSIEMLETADSATIGFTNAAGDRFELVCSGESGKPACHQRTAWGKASDIPSVGVGCTGSENTVTNDEKADAVSPDTMVSFDTVQPDTKPDTTGPDTPYTPLDTAGPDTTWLDTLWPDTTGPDTPKPIDTGVDTSIDTKDATDAKVLQDDATPDISVEAGSTDAGADVSTEATGGETTPVEGDATTADGLISVDTAAEDGTVDAEPSDAYSPDITPILLASVNFCFVSNDCNKDPKLPCIALGGLIMENGEVQDVTDFSVFVDPNAADILKFWSPTVGKEITFIQASEPTGNTGDWSWSIEGDMVNTTGAMNLIYMPADGIFDLNFFMDDLSSAYKYCKHYYTSCSAEDCSDVLIQ